jgi:prevent-host-death family protein
MRDISATEASRHFSEVLDAVEHRHESFVVVRKGRSVARIIPEPGMSGSDAKALLRRHRPDPGWIDELRRLREGLESEDRWRD